MCRDWQHLENLALLGLDAEPSLELLLAGQQPANLVVGMCQVLLQLAVLAHECDLG